MHQAGTFEAIVIGSSAGGIKALTSLLTTLPADFPLPILITQHLHPDSDSYLASILNDKCAIAVKQADEKELILPGTAYIAPPNYHMLIEEDRTIALNIDPRVMYARPSVDVMFECAAEVYRGKLIGIILTGANSDGAAGMASVKKAGGYTIVQDPNEAEADSMPRSALRACKIDKVLPVQEIGPFVLQLVNASLRRRKKRLSFEKQ